MKQTALAIVVALAGLSPLAAQEPVSESPIFDSGLRLSGPWSIGPRLDQARAGLSATVLDGRVYAAGGAGMRLGLAAAILSGTAMGAIHALFTVQLKAEQIVSGIALPFLGLGLSGYGFRLTQAQGGSAVQVPGFRELDLFGFADLPFVGPILFGQHALIYIAIGSAIALAWMLSSTRLGLMIKAAGDYPQALDAGVDHLGCVGATRRSSRTRWTTGRSALSPKGTAADW